MIINDDPQPGPNQERTMSHLPHFNRPGRNNRIFALLFALGSWSIATGAQDPLKTLPQNYKSVLDNSAVAVIRAHYGPHEKIPVHDHSSFSTVFVYLSDSGPVRIDHAEEKPVSVIRPPTVKGSYRVVTGMAERHSIENLGDLSSDFLRVELKQVSLDLKEPFRGKAPASPLQDQNSIEFTNSALQIQRIICVDTPTCPVNSSPSPSLLITFTPVSLVIDASGKKAKLDAGAVCWLPTSQAATLTADAASVVHILRILLPTAKGVTSN
jgi:hypothetical protein